jgi:hypothetical protein
MAGSDENRDRSGKLSAEDQRWSHRSNTRWLNDRKVG